ncbi:MAG TPA: saccharopine dehydrogenase NADP-binding domain-containing protein [Gemmatimonadaceae bacterium]|nr:saccharopine dehydrogenase NADP-binding domain-containing protein [Gemmatimonadaceae bacterium]
MSRYDIVVFGATGSAGRAIASYLDRVAAANGIRWAVAGRNASALDALRRSLRTKPGAIVADALDDAAVRRMVGETRVLLAALGPFVLYGEPALRACAEAGVDYVDITGETAHVRRMIDRYHARAEHSGARIVPLCGFDSVPSDLGAFLLAEHGRARGAELRQVKGYFQYAGGYNAGTAASTRELWRRPADLQAMRDPILLNPHETQTDAERAGNADPAGPIADQDLGRWVAPFFMAPINTRVVRRSAALFREWGEPYGAGFRYQEYWDTNSPLGFVAASAASMGMAAYQLMARQPGAADWIAPFARGAFPDAMRPANPYFRAQFVGKYDDGTSTWAEVADRGDPATDVTAKIVSEAALALADDGADRTSTRRAGILTPATALGLRLVSRLRNAGVGMRCPACRV